MNTKANLMFLSERENLMKEQILSTEHDMSLKPPRQAASDTPVATIGNETIPATTLRGPLMDQERRVAYKARRLEALIPRHSDHTADSPYGVSQFPLTTFNLPSFLAP
jgi:hypothetical protein